MVCVDCFSSVLAGSSCGWVPAASARALRLHNFCACKYNKNVRGEMLKAFRGPCFLLQVPTNCKTEVAKGYVAAEVANRARERLRRIFLRLVRAGFPQARLRRICPLTFAKLPLSFIGFSLKYRDFSLAFRDFSLTFRDFSLTFRDFSLTFKDFSLTFR